MGWEEQFEQVAALHQCHAVLDALPPDAKVLMLIDDGENYRTVKYGQLSKPDALWMIRAFEHSVLFPRMKPPGES